MNRTFDFATDGEVAAPPARKPAGFAPRPYQIDAVTKVLFALGYAEACGLYLATGTGKTEVAAHLISQWDGGVLFIAPRRELVRQTAERLRKRGVQCGIEMAADTSDERVTVACYASLRSRNRYRKFLKTVTLIIVDEAHVNYSTSALEMLGEFRSFGGHVVAMTASPPNKKGDEYVLEEHYGEAAYIYSYLDAVADGWLVPVKLHLCVLQDLDLSKFKASFGDFDQRRLDNLMRKRANVAGVGRMVEQYWEGKKSVIFATSIDHAEAIRDDLLGRKIEASIIHSQMEPEEQDMHLRDFMAGRSDIIINVGILTMGWDCPAVQKLFIARCTASATLYTQMFGRGTRALPGILDGLATVGGRKAAIAASGKPHFEVYDITDSSRTNSVVTALDVLYPDLQPEIRERVQRQTERKALPKDDLDKIIEQERKAEAARRAAADRIEMQRRLGIEVGGHVTAYQRSVTAGADRRGKGKAKEFWWMPFGKHRGKSLKKVFACDPGYLPWMLEQGYLKDSLRKNTILLLRKHYTDASPGLQQAISRAFKAAGV